MPMMTMFGRVTSVVRLRCETTRMKPNRRMFEEDSWESSVMNYNDPRSIVDKVVTRLPITWRAIAAGPWRFVLSF